MFGTYRTLLALMVVALHLGGLSMGGYAVFGFYVLSGYLMTLIMQNNYGYSALGFYKYALNRFLRIYPIYWVSIVFSAILVWYFGQQFARGFHPAIFLPTNISDLARNVFLYLHPVEAPRLTPPAWALTVELFYYVVIGVGASRNKLLTLIWFAASVAYHFVTLILGFGWEHRYYTIPAASLPFSTGALIFHYRPQLSQFVDRLKGSLYEYLPYIIFASILGNWLVGDLLGRTTGAFFYSNYILCSIMVVVLSRRKTLPFISKRFDGWMGDFSYPVYLFHIQIGMLAIFLLGAAGIDLERPNLLLMVVSIPLIFAFSWVVTLSLERPIELLRAKVKKR
jgi:peptidoglycan/LPS O-acetylase OafA/YrhL